MPIYEYECPECGAVAETYKASSKDADFLPLICEFGHSPVNMKRIISCPHVRIGRETENKSALKKLKKISGES